MGVYMGIFNFFIVIPQIIASVGLGWVMQHVHGNDRILAVVVGGISIGIAAILTLRVKPVEGRQGAPEVRPRVPESRLFPPH